MWRPIKGYEGLYEISNKGRVKSLARYYKAFGYRKIIIEEKIMSPVESPQGYYQIGLSKEGAKKHVQIHRLVAQAFIPNPQSLPFINHKDENKKNNCVDNLEWCTPLSLFWYWSISSLVYLFDSMSALSVVGVFCKP